MRRMIVVDDTGVLRQCADEILRSLDVEFIWVRGADEMPAALEKAGRDDCLVVNLTRRTRAWPVMQRVRARDFEGQILALVDHLGDPDTGPIMDWPRAVCVARSSTTAELTNVLARLLSGELSEGPAAPPPEGPAGFHGMVGRSARMREVFAQIAKVARSDVTVCITGESGTGKELVARAIHEASARHRAPFVTLDCTTIPEGLMESQLFGHVKGAFTGAVSARDGVFALAHGGTVFIDELGELPLALQGKLLRVIQTRQVVKVGGGTPVQTNVRLVTATHRRLEEAVVEGAFREDLYYRVSVVTIRLPALRERPEDIPLLVDHFCQRLSVAYRKPIASITPAALRRLVAYDWPGNVRQLENVIERAFVLADSDTLTERDLFGEDAALGLGPGAAAPADDSLYEVEKAHILRVLHRVRGNRTEAARVLGISVRGLQYKLKAYGAQPDALTIPLPDPVLRLAR